MGTREVIIDGTMVVKCDRFMNDFLNNIDQVNSEYDIVRLWEVHRKVAAKLYSLLKDMK